MNGQLKHHRILQVEDDSRLASEVANFLSPHGFDVSIEGCGNTAVKRIIHEDPDAVIMEIDLPGLDGFSLCQAVRSTYRGLIVMLTARGDEIDEVVGLEVGADDFLTKPVRSRALLARLQARLRRAPPQTRTSTVRVGSLTVDPGRRSVELDSVTVDVSTAEFDLLYLLARNAGEPLSRNYIHQEVVGVECGGISRSIDLRVSRLRKKLGDDATRPQRIKSVRGIGYMLAVYP